MALRRPPPGPRLLSRVELSRYVACVSHRTPLTRRPTRAAFLVASAALFGGLVPTAASAAQRVENFDLPSNGNVVLTASRLNKIDRLTANVLLPDGYDAQP